MLLQYLIGLQRLGWNVIFIDRLGDDCDAATSLRWTRGVLARAGLGAGAYSVLGPRGESVAGLSRDTLIRRARRSSAILNIMGYLEDDAVLAAAPQRIFLDIDPGYPQLWRELGLADVLSGHDGFATVGLRIGTAGCDVPTCGLPWTHTLPPVVLAEWPAGDCGTAYTSVGAWRGPYGRLEYRSKLYGSRVHAFRRLLQLPRLVAPRLEVALDIHPADERDRALLTACGWALADPRTAAGDPDRYREYVGRARGEISIAQSLYVETRGGWFSDRSACYLAAGKPVVALDTGFGARLPTGEGLLVFTDVETAADAIRAVERDLPRHAAAARGIAEEHLDSDRVLSRLLGAFAIS
jgi:glycosyltransferase involved in cell wall biosynthesis